MCRGIDHGNRRCPADTSEKRRLRRRNQQALQSIAIPTKIQHKPAEGLRIDREVSPADIEDQISKVEELKAKASRPMPGGKQKIWEQIETETIRTGALFQKFVEQETGQSDENIREAWEQRRRTLEQRLSTLPDHEREETSRELREMMTPQGAETRRIAKKRGEETLRILQRFRPMGGTFSYEDDSHVAHSHRAVSRFFPSDWIEQSEENGTRLELSTIAGSGGRYQNHGDYSSIQVGADYVAGSQLEGEPYLQEYSQDNLNSLLLHETTHHMEFLSRKDDKSSLGNLQKTFLERRTTHDGKREEPLTPDKLGELAPDAIVYADNFSDAYAGRVYEGNSSYEILTVGAESVFTGKQGGLMGIGNCAPDPDHKSFVLGVWLTHRRK